MSLSYIIREGAVGFRRAKLATAGSVITICIALLFLGAMYLISMNTSRLIESVRARVEMEAFLTEPVTAQKVTELQNQIMNIAGVERVQFVSKEDAAKTFQKEFGEDIKSILDFNPLPPSMKIFLKESYRSTEKADVIQKQISFLKGVDKIVYRRDLLEFIETQAKTIGLVGMSVGCFIALSSMFLVANTIRLTIHAKRKTLRAMQLVGATRWFVRVPFLLEGLLQGLAGGILAAGILYYALTAGSEYISRDLREFIAVDPGFYPAVCALGVVLGLFGSVVSVRKYIRDTIGP